MFEDLSFYHQFLPSDAPSSIEDLDERLKIFSENGLDIWYSPMGEITENPKLWILGITPGWNQMRIAYSSTAESISAGMTPSAADSSRKPQVAFAGSMRTNLVTMLDQLGVPSAFNVKTAADLFGTSVLRTGSILKYPVFKNAKNYTGSSPKPLSHPALREMIETVFVRELRTSANCLILPLGRTVESVLDHAILNHGLSEERVLRGFPHPSGANGHRKKHFELAKSDLARRIHDWAQSK